MKSAKVRKMERKAKHKALAVAKTIKSRQRRLDNKAKRAEIHAIDPSIKITIVNGIPYLHNENGDIVELVNGIYTVVEDKDTEKLVEEIVEVFNPEIEEMEAVEVDDVGRFRKLTNKWRL